MKLLRIRLRDFRGVHDREIALAEHGVTVLQGDNEVGKTSTVQALDLLFDVQDSSKKNDVRAVAPTHVDAGPEVEAEIVTGAYRFVYRKRWVRQPITELTVLEPRREQLTGRDAHARVTAILDETMDRELWKALRIEQHTPLGQADLAGNDALARALDQAAGGASDSAGAADDGLVDRALTEVRRYHTATGRATNELRDAATRLDDARAEHERCRDAVAAVERDVAERDRLDAEAVSLAARRREHHAQVAELEDRWAALQSRLREVEAAAEHAVHARERATAARDRRTARDTLVTEVAACADAVTAASARVADHEHEHAAAREHRDTVHVAHEVARTTATGRRAEARTAEDALARGHDRAELADLERRLQRVADAEAGVHAAERTLTEVTVDAAALARLETLELAVVRAEAARDAGAATLELDTPDGAPALDVVLDGKPTRLEPGTTRRLPVAGPVEVAVPGVLGVRVRPGVEGHGLADAVRAAADALADACASAGVDGVETARAEVRRAEDADRRRAEHRATLDRELAGRSPADVRAAHGRLRARLAAEPEPIQPDQPADAEGLLLPDGATPAAGSTSMGTTDRAEPADAEGLVFPGDSSPATVATTEPDLDALRAAAEQARTSADDAATRAEEADRRRREADDAVRAGDIEAAGLAERLAQARLTHERRAGDLAAARAESADEALGTEEADRLARAREAENAHQSLAAALAGDDPDTVEAWVVNARQVRERLATDAAALEKAQHLTTGRLEVVGHQGLHDQLTRAHDELVLAEGAHTAVDRRARAAARLYGALVRHRDEVRRAYVAPFRTQVERLARIVFGPGLALEVDPQLRITHRTLDGVTVAFEELSSGAKEQLGLCARLACAALVDPSDGVPVVIDDALGHCDPQRLARLGAVFTAATSGGGAGGQVVVLTCTPERYRGVGAATVVQLTASRSEAGTTRPDTRATPTPSRPASPAAAELQLDLPETG